jgi:rhodanese-related sulfurtransferase
MNIRYAFLPFMILLYSCANGQPAEVQNAAYDLMLKALLSRDVKEIGVEQAFSMKDNIIFLDSRTKEEYKVSHIKDAVRIGYENFEPSKLEGFDKNGRIVVYCAVGARSEKVVEKLEDMGFKEVLNLYGGIFEWVNQGYPVYEQDTLLTNNVHTYSKVWGIWLSKGNKIYSKEND